MLGKKTTTNERGCSFIVLHIYPVKNVSFFTVHFKFMVVGLKRFAFYKTALGI